MAYDIKGTITRGDRVASGVTTNTTTPVFEAPSGPKTFYAEVVGTGAVTQTWAIYGTPYPTAINGVLLATITLNDTTRDQEATPVITGNFTHFYAITTNTTGTGATGALFVMY